MREEVCGDEPAKLLANASEFTGDGSRGRGNDLPFSLEEASFLTFLVNFDPAIPLHNSSPLRQHNRFPLSQLDSFVD